MQSRVPLGPGKFHVVVLVLTKIAVSIDSILIMLLLEISGEHVLLMLFSFPQFRLSCKGDNKFTDFGKASEPVSCKFI